MGNKMESVDPVVKIISTDCKLVQQLLAAMPTFGIRLAFLCRHPSLDNISLQFGRTGLAE